jgi:hypothetical protein
VVDSKPGVCFDERPDSPAAAWYCFILFPNIRTLCECLGTSIGIFRPAGGDISHQTQDHLMYGSIGRFAVFAHVVVFVVHPRTA